VPKVVLSAIVGPGHFTMQPGLAGRDFLLTFLIVSGSVAEALIF
jgi:hypothetical protein